MRPTALHSTVACKQLSDSESILFLSVATKHLIQCFMHWIPELNFLKKRKKKKNVSRVILASKLEPGSSESELEESSWEKS